MGCRRAKVRKPIRIHVETTDNEVYLQKKNKGHTKHGSGLLWDVLSGWLTTGVRAK